MGRDVSADGLRGLAATNVVLCHFLIAIFPLGFRHLWPVGNIQEVMSTSERVISLPFLSILWNGNFPVCIFFVLSGYVLSSKFSFTGDTSDLTIKTLRRFLRLALPILGSVLFAFLLMSTGTTAWKDAAALTGSTWLGSFWNFTPTVSDALKDGLYRAILLGTSAYVPVLWTMKIELIGSLLVFGYAALVPRGVLALPFFTTIMAVVISVTPESWPFYAGFLIGVHIGRMSGLQSRRCVIFSVAASIFFGSFDLSPVYEWTSWICPDFVLRKNFFNILGGVCLVYAVHAGFGLRFLSSRPVQYLGRISYSLYLVHFPLVLTLYSVLYVKATGLGLSRISAVAVAMPVTFACACATASMFQRSFDTWGVALSHRIFPGRTG